MVCGWVSLAVAAAAHWHIELVNWTFGTSCAFLCRQAGRREVHLHPASPSGTDDNGKGADGNSSSPSDSKHFRTPGWSHRFLCNAPGWFSGYYCKVAVSSNSNSNSRSRYLYLSPTSMFCLFIIPMASSHVIPRSRSHVMIPSRPEPLS